MLHITANACEHPATLQIMANVCEHSATLRIVAAGYEHPTTLQTVTVGREQPPTPCADCGDCHTCTPVKRSARVCMGHNVLPQSATSLAAEILIRFSCACQTMPLTDPQQGAPPSAPTPALPLHPHLYLLGQNTSYRQHERRVPMYRYSCRCCRCC